mmetsp:Transcript_16121/g.39582  ORF Transcript_16121/g.39582 Transcript_16121/m.39582 type:complete len:321 (+) Transcript_16121:34-996(+)
MHHPCIMHASGAATLLMLGLGLAPAAHAHVSPASRISIPLATVPWLRAPVTHRSPASSHASRILAVLTTEATSPAEATQQSSRPAPELTIPGDTLETLPSHVAYTLGLTGVVGAIAVRALLAAPGPAAAWLAVALVLGDLMSGVIHWATDNYGNINTPVVGTVCAAFQGHHKAPWTITHRSFFNNVHKIAKTALPMVAVAVATLPPVGAAFVSFLLYTQLLAQELHRWSHCLPGELSPWQREVQGSGLVLSRREHLAHHQAPFDSHYSIFLGWTNRLTDRLGLYRKLEAFVYACNGVEPNCWKEEKGGSAVRELALASRQ